jgi:hypothetical protein
MRVPHSRKLALLAIRPSLMAFGLRRRSCLPVGKLRTIETNRAQEFILRECRRHAQVEAILSSTPEPRGNTPFTNHLNLPRTHPAWENPTLHVGPSQLLQALHQRHDASLTASHSGGCGRASLRAGARVVALCASPTWLAIPRRGSVCAVSGHL